MPRISVIIPVYNTESYLKRCLESLQNQSVTDWEAICVDDGSTDGSGAILDAFAARDPRFRVVHKDNGGVSSARNLAIGLIRGDFTLIMDSDDFLHPQLMEICLHFALRDCSDLVCFTYDRAFHRRSRTFGHDIFPQFKSYDPTQIRCKIVEDLLPWTTEYAWRSHLLHHRWVVKHCQPWRCLYRSDLIRPLRFPEGVIFEDLPWWCAVLLRTGRSSIINLPLYFYSDNEHGYMGSSQAEERIRSMRITIELSEKYAAEHGTPGQQLIWENEFLVPFRKRLRHCEKRLARKCGKTASQSSSEGL